MWSIIIDFLSSLHRVIDSHRFVILSQLFRMYLVVFQKLFYISNVCLIVVCMFFISQSIISLNKFLLDIIFKFLSLVVFSLLISFPVFTLILLKGLMIFHAMIFLIDIIEFAAADNIENSFNSTYIENLLLLVRINLLLLLLLEFIFK